MNRNIVLDLINELMLKIRITLQCNCQSSLVLLVVLVEQPYKAKFVLSESCLQSTVAQALYETGY